MKAPTSIEPYELVLVSIGRDHEYPMPRGGKRTVKIDRVWHVMLGMEIIGTVRYEMVTHEQRTPGRRYVNKRWQVPAYRWSMGDKRYGRALEADSRKWAVDSIIRDHKRGQSA